MISKHCFFVSILLGIFWLHLPNVYTSPVTLSYSKPASGAQFTYPDGVSTSIETSGVNTVKNIINEFTCTRNSVPTYTNSSINLSSGTTVALLYPNTALGNCKLQVTSAPGDVATPYPSVTFTIISSVSITAPSSMIVGVGSVVNVTSSNPTGYLNSFSLILRCGTTTQSFTGNYNTPLTIIPASNMTAQTGCTLGVPASGVYSGAVKGGIKIQGTITFSSVIPNPVTANTDLSVQLTISNSSTISTITTLACNAGNQSVTSSSTSFTLPVPSYFIGNCSLYTAESTAGSIGYVQYTPAFVTVNGTLTWIRPQVNTYLVSGESQSILVNSSSSTTASLNLYIGDSTSLGVSITNVSMYTLIPYTFPRGPTDLSAFTVDSYFNSPSNISVFVNTTVTFDSPVNGSEYYANALIPVRLVAADSKFVSGIVELSCSSSYNSIQTVNSSAPTYFTSPTSGQCSLQIQQLTSSYTMFYPYSDLSITVLTEASLYSPGNYSTYNFDNPIPVQLASSSSEEISGTVQMNCTSQSPVSQIVRSAEVTDYLPVSKGLCSFEITSLTSSYAVIAVDSTVFVDVNSTVSFLTPVNGGTFLANAAIPVQLIANDGQVTTGQVQMRCSNDVTSIQTVSSLTSTNFYSSTLSGTCTFMIISLETPFTSISVTSNSVTLSTLTSPTGGPLIVLTEEEQVQFLARVTFSSTASAPASNPNTNANQAGNNNNFLKSTAN